MKNLTDKQESREMHRLLRLMNQFVPYSMLWKISDEADRWARKECFAWAPLWECKKNCTMKELTQKIYKLHVAHLGLNLKNIEVGNSKRDYL